MKLILSLLLVCLVTISQQENLARAHYRARAHYLPLFYSNGLPAGYDLIDDNKAQEIVPRNNNAEKPLNRFLNNLLTPINNLITITSTVTSAVPSVITTANVVNCIPSAQFAAGSTSACARRRRRDIAELLEESAPVQVQPAVPLPLEASAVIESKEIQHPQADISSSMDDPAVDHPKIEERFSRVSLTTVKTVTVFTTTFSFTAQAITATKTLGAASGLVCLPGGYVICK